MNQKEMRNTMKPYPKYISIWRKENEFWNTRKKYGFNYRGYG